MELPEHESEDEENVDSVFPKADESLDETVPAEQSLDENRLGPEIAEAVAVEEGSVVVSAAAPATAPVVPPAHLDNLKPKLSTTAQANRCNLKSIHEKCVPNGSCKKAYSKSSIPGDGSSGKSVPGGASVSKKNNALPPTDISDIVSPVVPQPGQKKAYQKANETMAR